MIVGAECVALTVTTGETGVAAGPCVSDTGAGVAFAAVELDAFFRVFVVLVAGAGDFALVVVFLVMVLCDGHANVCPQSARL